tara:strand:+ start:147 stop:1034 length:888 start_codon:yes stop_codon:yes gene_type:complete
MDKSFYNLASSERLGWKPDWFGEQYDEFDEDLEEAIIKFQKEHRLKADGLCGPGTFRRLIAHRESEMEEVYEQITANNRESFIIYNKNYYDIEWPKVILPFNRGGLTFSKGLRRSKELRKPNMFVTHWDVCLNAATCHRVLERRGLSIHFTIDNDGTIRQHMDINDVAFHAGSRRWNDASIGLEISNAYYPKYQKWYKRNVGEERPIKSGAKVHGKTLDDFTDFYPVQLEALKALYRAVHKATGIPLATPKTQTVSSPCVSGKFKGFISHYHLTKGKIDCAGLDIAKILKEIEDE